MILFTAFIKRVCYVYLYCSISEIDFISYNYVHKYSFSHKLLHVYSKNYAVLALIFEFTHYKPLGDKHAREARFACQLRLDGYQC